MSDDVGTIKHALALSGLALEYLKDAVHCRLKIAVQREPKSLLGMMKGEAEVAKQCRNLLELLDPAHILEAVEDPEGDLVDRANAAEKAADEKTTEAPAEEEVAQPVDTQEWSEQPPEAAESETPEEPAAETEQPEPTETAPPETGEDREPPPSEEPDEEDDEHPDWPAEGQERMHMDCTACPGDMARKGTVSQKVALFECTTCRSEQEGPAFLHPDEAK